MNKNTDGRVYTDREKLETIEKFIGAMVGRLPVSINAAMEGQRNQVYRFITDLYDARLVAETTVDDRIEKSEIARHVTNLEIVEGVIGEARVTDMDQNAKGWRELLYGSLQGLKALCR